MSSRLSNPKVGVRVIIMQRLHQDDLSGHVLRKGGYQHLKLPSEFHAKKRTITFRRIKDSETGELRWEKFWEDPRQDDGELLFEALFDEEVLEQAKKDLGDAYVGQHQQEPSPPEGGLFKKKYWRFHRPDGRPNWGPHPRPDGCNEEPARVLPPLEMALISLDAAFKGKAKSDFVCFTVWGVSRADRFLLECVNRKMTFPETLDEFKRLVEEYPLAIIKIVEDAANGPAIVDTLQTEIPGIELVTPKGGKEARAAAVSPQVRSGNVYLPEGAPWLEEYIGQLAAFPNAANDDQVDSTSQALLYLSANPEIANALAMAKD